jgi:hypothetical protein
MTGAHETDPQGNRQTDVSCSYDDNIRAQFRRQRARESKVTARGSGNGGVTRGL